MDPIERDAFNIVKGQMQGDEYLWDAVWYTPEGEQVIGGWKSQIEKHGNSA